MGFLLNEPMESTEESVGPNPSRIVNMQVPKEKA